MMYDVVKKKKNNNEAIYIARFWNFTNSQNIQEKAKNKNTPKKEKLKEYFVIAVNNWRVITQHECFHYV